MPAKKGDSGHAINAVNVGKIVDEVKSLESLYQPPSTSLELAELEKEVIPSLDVVKAVAKPFEIYRDTTDRRKAQSNKIDGLLKNAQASFEASDDVTKEQIERFATACDLVTGANVVKHSRKKKKAKSTKTNGDPQATPTVHEESEQTHSVSQQSFTKREANSYDAVSILEAISNYNPKDTTASTSYIRAEIDKFHALNKEVDTNYKPYGTALKTRDTKLYAPKTGSVTIAKRVKAYVRKSTVFSASQKKAFANIQFKMPKKEDLHL